MNTILIVDDEPNYLIVLSELLAEEGYETLTADNGRDALETVRRHDLDLIITDMQMPGMDGFSLLDEVKRINPHLPVIMITAYGEVEKAVRAMRGGAFNYLTKPFNNDELVASIAKAVEHYGLHRENLRLHGEVKGRYRFDNIIGKSTAMRQIYSLIEKLAPTAATVLITGESGTGKELVAKAIHYNSPRAEQPFVSLNCAALPESLLESELFGHEKGAFTGAVDTRKGKFEAAAGGTIFLDEIGEMPLSTQAKLLRVLQEKCFERLGSNKTIKVDLRIIAATNKDLKDEVDNRRFREDLFYRLNVIHIPLPPLRERSEDIPLLARYFCEKYAEQAGRPELTLAAETVSLLMSLPWEGNIRELENTIERATILAAGPEIMPEDVYPEGGSPAAADLGPEIQLEQLIPANATLPEVLNGIEEKMVRKALDEANFVQTKAAKRLGITKSLLQYKMRKFNIKRPGRA